MIGYKEEDEKLFDIIGVLMALEALMAAGFIAKTMHLIVLRQ